MSKFEDIILLIIPLILISVCIGLFIALFINSFGDFEYIDLDGNKGKASQCYVSRAYYSCVTEDGENIMVQSYKRV